MTHTITTLRDAVAGMTYEQKGYYGGELISRQNVLDLLSAAIAAQPEPSEAAKWMRDMAVGGDGYLDQADITRLHRVADRITQLEAENAALREALEPFAKATDIRLCGEWRDEESIQRTDVAFHIKFGHLRTARRLTRKDTV